LVDILLSYEFERLWCGKEGVFTRKRVEVNRWTRPLMSSSQNVRDLFERKSLVFKVLGMLLYRSSIREEREKKAKRGVVKSGPFL